MKRLLVFIITLCLVFALASCAKKAESPIVENDEPVIDEPVADEPVADEPVADEPVADEPVADEPVADEPVVDEPVVDEPVADEPVVDEPVVDEPVADEPVQKDVFWEYPFKDLAVEDYVTLEKSDYTGLEYSHVDTQVTEEEISESINGYLETFATFESVERPAKNTDTVVIDFTGSIDGVKFDGGSAANQTLVLGEGGYIDGFEDGILGHCAGETFTIDVTFPSDYGVPSLDGKQAQFEIVLRSVQEKKVPEFTNEFFAENTTFANAVAYTEYVVTSLQKIKETNATNTQKNEILATILERAQIKEEPKLLYDFFYSMFIKPYETTAQDEGITLEDLLSQMGATMEELVYYADEYANEMTGLELVLYAIAKKENLPLDLTKSEYDKQINSYAENLGTTAADLEEYYSLNELALSFVHDSIMNYLLSISTEKK